MTGPSGTDWVTARRTAGRAAVPLPAVLLPLAEVAGATLAAPLVALVPLPAADTAAMDGWAVRGPGPWRVVGRVLAGDPPPAPLGPQEAAEVATGAVVPDGSEGVLPYEHGRAAEQLTGPPPAGRHVRRTGEECAAGEQVLPAGTVLGASALGLAAALGHDVLPVHRRPVVTALVTGSELLRSGLPGQGRVRDAVGPLLLPSVPGYGGVLREVVHVPDSLPALLAAVRDAVGDVVLTSGASSVGRADHLAAVLSGLGAQLLVDGVAVKPGHPQLLARLPDGRLLVGLPGNPLAALCGLVTLVGPLLAGLSGRGLPELVPARLSVPLAALDVHRLVPVRLDRGAATPTGHGGAAMLRGAAVAAGFAVVEPGRDLSAGDPVDVLPLPA